MNICLDDIREKLEKIEDKEISLSIIDYLNNVQKYIEEKDALLTTVKDRNEKLLEENNKLFARVTQSNEAPTPDAQVDYENIIERF